MWRDGICHIFRNIRNIGIAKLSEYRSAIGTSECRKIENIGSVRSLELSEKRNSQICRNYRKYYWNCQNLQNSIQWSAPGVEQKRLTS